MSPPVKSADRVLQIFELLTDNPEGMTLVEIQTRMGLPKSSTHGLLQTMVSRGFLAQDPGTRKFRVGVRLWQAGRSYLSAASIEQVAMPYMQRVRDTLNETVQLALLDGTDNVYIAKVDPDQQLRLASHVGARLPAYATGIGKALLSTLDDDEVRRRYGDTPFERFTPSTLADVSELIDVLARVRELGHAEDHGEYTRGVFCLAMPIAESSDHVRTAISVSVPDVRTTDELIDNTLTCLREAAEAIAQRLP